MTVRWRENASVRLARGKEVDELRSRHFACGQRVAEVRVKKQRPLSRALMPAVFV